MINKKDVLSRLEKLEAQWKETEPLIITLDYGDGNYKELRIDFPGLTN